LAAQQIILVIINVLGGAVVIGSYIHGFVTHPGSGNALWGGVTGWLRSAYGISMILAALGYFVFVYFILFRINPSDIQISGRFGFSLFYFIFIGILIPSSIWMPLTHAMVANPSTSLWIWIRIVLVIVGIASCALVWALLSLHPREAGAFYWLAVGGSAYFAFHTAFLDMLLWPLLFRIHS
jgi:hypothetical protein